MPLDPSQFRGAMGSLANGVTLITVTGSDGALLGMTATAVSSLSLKPPLLLACIGHEASLHDVLVAAPRFGVVILGEAQRDLAERFAEHGRQAFAAATPRTPGGLPLVTGAIATIDCVRRNVLEGGDHSILVGELEWAVIPGGAPLLHFRGRYGAIAK